MSDVRVFVPTTPCFTFVEKLTVSLIFIRFARLYYPVQAEFKALPESNRVLQSFKRKACEELFRTLLVTVAFRKTEGGATKKEKEDKFNESLQSLGIISTVSVDDVNKIDITNITMDDNDNDDSLWKLQQLSVDSCDVGLLSPEVGSIVSPVLTRHQGGSFSLDDFCSLMMIEVNHIGPGALSVLRNNPGVGETGMEKQLSAREKADAIVFKFHPEINKKSRKIIENKRLVFNSKNKEKDDPVAQIAMLYKAHKIFLQTQEERRKKQWAIDDEECTFQPQIFSGKSSKAYLRGKKGL